MQLLKEPTLQEAERVIARALKNKELLLIVGSCSVDYSGRAASQMGEGERVVMIKEDRSVTVHKKDRHAPVNYQTAGCEVKALLEDGSLLVDSYKSKIDDRLVVKFSKLEFVGAFSLQDSEDISVLGREKDMVKLVLAQPELIEEGLKLEKTEKRIIPGAIDIYCRDKDGNFVVVELKRRTAGLQEVNQLDRYVTEVRRLRGKENVRGILCAPRLSPNAKEMLERNNLEFIKLDPSIEKFKEGELSLVMDQSKLEDF